MSNKLLFYLHHKYTEHNHLAKQYLVEQLNAYRRSLRQRLNILTSFDSKEPGKFIFFDFRALIKPAIPKKLSASYEELDPGGLRSITHYQPTPSQNYTSPATWDDFLGLFSPPIYTGSGHLIKKLDFLRKQIADDRRRSCWKTFIYYHSELIVRLLPDLNIISSFEKSVYIKYLKEQIKLIRKKVASLLPKTFPQPRRDLRETFRSIVRFLFKNMDDCSGENNALKNLTYQPLLIPNNYLYDKEREHSFTQRNTRQR